MITEQIITYIKDQIARGISREKIRGNLLSAGWEEVDIQQAFSFAQPNGENAALKIAPAFAVVDPVAREVSVDKTELVKDDKPFIPILKKDNEVKSSYKPEDHTEEKLTVMNHTEPTVNPQPVASTAPASILVTRTAPKVAVNTFGDEGEIHKPKMSSVLKSLALFLTIVLIVGNAFLWLFVMPKIDKQNQEKNTALNTQMGLDNAVAQNPRQIADVENEETNSIAPFGNTGSTNTVEVLKQPTLAFKNSADAYFLKYNTYGSVAMQLGSCGVSSTIFADPSVKFALSEMTGLTKNIPQCSLTTDDTAKKNRMTQYLVYIPMDKGGYCIDNTGAAIAVIKKPTTISCVSGL